MTVPHEVQDLDDDDVTRHGVVEYDAWAALGDDESRARAAALVLARELLGTARPDTVDLHNLASYIMTGNDPWQQYGSQHAVRGDEV